MRRKLTESEWSRVFELRCRAKRGEYLRPEDQALVEKAWRENPVRYSEMTEPVFEETAPFGSRYR
jgi:hypothetical protein